jgi:uncharacterized protein YbjT (DUF2867 family)
VSAERPLAVLGATGYTGRLVVDHARELGLPLRLVGRRRSALEGLARDGEEIRVADARQEAELIEAFDGSFAVASTAGRSSRSARSRSVRRSRSGRTTST